MSTQYPEMFAALAAPFPLHEVKKRSQSGRELRYVTARTIMNRLDTVLGPEGWWDDYVPGENSVLCRLTIVLPDGRNLTKADAGGYAGMADSGDDDKSGYSDAFKRAAVKFGVSRYLYGDGVPTFVTERAPAPTTQGPATSSPSRAATWPSPGPSRNGRRSGSRAGGTGTARPPPTATSATDPRSRRRTPTARGA